MAFGIAFSMKGQYIIKAETPNAQLYLPAPPDTLLTSWAPDIYYHFKAKHLRTTPRGEQVSHDWRYDVDTLLRYQEPGFGHAINTTLPNMRKLVIQSVSSFELALPSKIAYKRLRPCVKFREASFNVEYSSARFILRNDIYSYPSAHSNRGWGLGMLLAMVNPYAQDTILSRAYQFGQSRVIGGVHWQSDVDMGRLTSTACIARLMAKDTFLEQLELSRQELAEKCDIPIPEGDSITYFEPNNMPDFTKFIPAPPVVDTPPMAYDLSQYAWGLSQRNSEKMTEIKRDANIDMDNLAETFMPLLEGVLPNPISTPEIYSLLEYSYRATTNSCINAQEFYQRERPHVFFNTTPADGVAPADTSGSYPSLQAALGWGTALAMMIVNPSQQDSILMRGMDVGENAIIAGTAWQSDVMAGRMLACCAFARLCSYPPFVEQVRRARAEYERVVNGLVTDTPTIRPDEPSRHENRLYTIDGRQALPGSRGVLVGKNRKIVR
ncbi:MAG: phosphatase PAP2 family protein [Muribaculaceae bacterium]|nr:phosphatase PAP2 family protein [Muribaculaceae bacterium]